MSAAFDASVRVFLRTEERWLRFGVPAAIVLVVYLIRFHGPFF